MKKLFFLSLFLWLHNCILSQSTYTQTHKEVEYNFGIIADEDMNTISEIEKIKYELRQVDQTHSKTINSSSQTTFEITIDHDDYEQSWMSSAKRFVYTPQGITLYDVNDSIMRTLSYSEDEAADNGEIANNIATNGYHPGLTVFPTYSHEIDSALGLQGIIVNQLGDTAMALIYANGTIETYNTTRLTITRQWIDEDGIINIQTNGYVPYQPNKGYLLQMRKRERFVQSVNGPCITEVKFTYYKDYVINDNLNLIDKAMENYHSITLFPNPNSGNFTVNVHIPLSDAITQTTITNLQTLSSFNVNMGNSTNFNVEMTAQPNGNYVIQVFTNQTTLHYNFIKSTSLPDPF